MKRLPENERLASFAPWKTAGLCVGVVLLALPLMALPAPAAAALRTHHPVPAPIDTAALGIALSLSTVLALGPLVRIPLADVFVRPPGRSAAGWGAFAGLLVAVVTATALWAGGGTVAVDRGPPPALVRTVLTAALFAAWAAVLEEFLVRGYLLSLIGHRWNWPAAIAVTSALFALLHHGHAAGPASLALYLGTTGTAGVLFALVTVSTGNVWNAAAIHATWNTLFSARLVTFRGPGGVAGETPVTVRLAAEPLLLGGGAVEPPESPLAILALLAGVGAVICWKRRRML